MTAKLDAYDRALTQAAAHARSWLTSVPNRPIGPRADAATLLDAFGGPLPAHGDDPAYVIDLLAENAEAGLMAIPSGRFFGWVMGGTLPAALAADWLVSAWDQNTGLRYATPAAAAIEEAAAAWVLELTGLPSGSDVGFTTGATMANFTGLAAGRSKVLAKVGWDVHELGLNGAPPVHVLVGEERHDTVDLALRYLGLGRPQTVEADEQGRLLVDRLEQELTRLPAGEPVLLCLQAGNLHSAAFDPFPRAIELAHQHGGWVHVDGAFGLWAAVSPRLAHLVEGVERADSWATDAHKTLNVPFDCGIVVVGDRAAMRSAMGVHASYLIADDSGPGDPMDKVPELSRRARGVPVWAALRSLGREGVVRLVDNLADRARQIADGVAGIEGATVLNDVLYTQVCISFGSDERTRAVTARLIEDGVTWMSGSRWQGRDVLRVSVSNWSTDEEDVRLSVDAVRRAVASVPL